MRKLHDRVVGELLFGDSWERTEPVVLFGRQYLVTLTFEGESDDDDDIDASQRRAFAAFDGNRDSFLGRAEKALLEHYQRVFPGIREMLGESADAVAPPVSTVMELAALMTPTHISFPLGLSDDGRVVGLILDCTWDPERGVGVKFVDEEVKEVGSQDIVL